jgi:hypothetical protein
MIPTIGGLPVLPYRTKFIKKKKELSYEEGYLLGLMEGRRLGMIEWLRERIIYFIKEKSKKNGILPSKKLIQKINNEIDIFFLLRILTDILQDEKLSITELDKYYDMLFFVPNEKSKIIKLCPFFKESLI